MTVNTGKKQAHKKPKKPLKEEARLYLNHSRERYTGSQNEDFTANLLTQVIYGLYISPRYNEKDTNGVMRANLSALEGI